MEEGSVKKICTKCKEEKSLEYFGKLAKSEDGHNYTCKACNNTYYIKKKEILPEGIKRCTSCKEVKEYSKFSKHSLSKSGLKSSCKVCCNLKNKEYHENNPDVAKDYRVNNKEHLKLKSAEYYQNNKEVIKENTKKWAEENPEKLKISKKKHADKNKKRYQDKNNERERLRRASDPEYRLVRNLRCLIGQTFQNALNGCAVRSKKSIEILGCDFDFFLEYIRYQFKDNMSFDNYGEWELDHIKPISSAKTIKEVEDLNHYTNFRPLWKHENRVKRDTQIEIQLRLL